METPLCVDAALSEFSRTRCTRSKFERLLSAVEAVLPICKGKLLHSHAVLRAWRRATPPNHAIPMPFRVMIVLAWTLAMQGWPRVGGLLIIQWSAGLRPGEVLQLYPEHLILPLAGTNRQPMISLGAKEGTKVGRKQVTFIIGRQAPIAEAVMRAFANSASPGCSLSSITTVSGYNRLLAAAAKTAGVQHHHYTAHSPRAGWATEMRIAGVAFSELQELGRWQSAHSLRIYLDVTAALFLDIDAGALASKAQWLEERFVQRFPWW